MNVYKQTLVKIIEDIKYREVLTVFIRTKNHPSGKLNDEWRELMGCDKFVHETFTKSLGNIKQTVECDEVM